MVVNLILLVDVCIVMVKQQWQTLFVDDYVFKNDINMKKMCIEGDLVTTH